MGKIYRGHIAQPDERGNPRTHIAMVLYVILHRELLLIVLFSHVLPALSVVDLHVCPLNANFFWRMIFYLYGCAYTLYAHLSRAFKLTMYRKWTKGSICETFSKTGK